MIFDCFLFFIISLLIWSFFISEPLLDLCILGPRGFLHIAPLVARVPLRVLCFTNCFLVGTLCVKTGVIFGAKSGLFIAIAVWLITGLVCVSFLFFEYSWCKGLPGLLWSSLIRLAWLPSSGPPGRLAGGVPVIWYDFLGGQPTCCIWGCPGTTYWCFKGWEPPLGTC